MNKVKAKLTLKENVTPQFVKARKVPFALRPRVEKELDKLVSDGILTKVDHSEWATPIVPVPKSNGDIRICRDFKVTLNPLLKVDQYPLPHIDEIFATLTPGKNFTKIDLKSAYLQMEVEEDCKQYLTISTHKGLLRYNRLVFGVASAPAIFQRTIEQILGGTPGVKVVLDDIIIMVEDDDEYFQNLEMVMAKLLEYGLKINPDKCLFITDRVEFCGHEIDANGLHKTQEKINAILKAPKIENVKQFRSFLGLVQYYAEFMKGLAEVLHPLHELLKKDVKWLWSNECENAVDKVKELITSEVVLTHYNPKYPETLASDASSFGLGAVLSHIMPNGEERPIAYASRT